MLWPLIGIAMAVVARRALDVVEVRGRSMTPALLPGDRLLVVRLAARVGDVVLAADPRRPSRELIKRVARVDVSGIHLLGDNPAASTDARAFGALPAAAVEWRALLRYWPPARAGRIPAPRMGTEPALAPIEEGGEPACAFPEALIAGS
ncbi:MAG: nickel-type superoxide dismutase maturation protease, partial [Candidatus Limnocylindria bacterium]